MTKVFALWQGGSSRSQGDAAEVEEFSSMQAATDAFIERFTDGYSFRQDMNFIAKPAQSVFTPRVDETSSMTIWLSNPLLMTADGKSVAQFADSDPYPDRMIEFDPKGGIIVNHY